METSTTAGFASRLRELRIRRGMRQQDLALALGLAQTTVANYENNLRFPDEGVLLRIADLFDTSLDYLLGRVASAPASFARLRQAHDPTARDRPLPSVVEEFIEHLLRHDRESALATATRSLAEGKTIREVYLEVLVPALHEVGRRWEQGLLQVSDEHLLSESTQVVIAQLYPLLRKGAAPKDGRRCIALATCGEPHVIAPRIVADFLELAGWEVAYLGGNLWIEHIVRAMRSKPPDLLALSVTMTHNLSSARELIDAVRASPELGAVKVLVGGMALESGRVGREELRADAVAFDAEEAVSAADTLVARSSHGS